MANEQNKDTQNQSTQNQDTQSSTSSTTGLGGSSDKTANSGQSLAVQPEVPAQPAGAARAVLRQDRRRKEIH
jgi:hypothetical protein